MPRPNVIFILTDDQGWDDLGCHGNPRLRTPRLEALTADLGEGHGFAEGEAADADLATELGNGHGGGDGVDVGEDGGTVEPPVSRLGV